MHQRKVRRILNFIAREPKSTKRSPKEAIVISQFDATPKFESVWLLYLSI